MTYWKVWKNSFIFSSSFSSFSWSFCFAFRGLKRAINECSRKYYVQIEKLNSNSFIGSAFCYKHLIRTFSNYMYILLVLMVLMVNFHSNGFENKFPQFEIIIRINIQRCSNFPKFWTFIPVWIRLYLIITVI